MDKKLRKSIVQLLPLNGRYFLTVALKRPCMLAYFTSSLTWLSINQNSLWCRMRFFADKNLSVVVKFFFCHSPGCPVIHNPGQVCVDLVNINSRGLFPRNDFDSVFGFIKGSQLFLALFEAYRICQQEFFNKS